MRERLLNGKTEQQLTKFFEDEQSFIDNSIEEPTLDSYKNIALALIELIEGVVKADHEKRIGNAEKELEIFESMLTFSEELDDEGASSVLPHILFSIWTMHTPNKYAAAYVLGKQHGAAEIKANNVKRAANGRRLIGTTTRAKVAKEADILRHKMTKGDAAYAIAEIVKKDSGTVKRYLTELFPGDKWTTTNQ